jgi:hypothetical protein
MKSAPEGTEAPPAVFSLDSRSDPRTSSAEPDSVPSELDGRLEHREHACADGFTAMTLRELDPKGWYAIGLLLGIMEKLGGVRSSVLPSP